ncbi:MAG: zinc ribbon domain-containing protein [Oscillospiraceae bacterium]
MNCTNCGSPLAEGAKFCTNCGTKTETPAQKLVCASCGLELNPSAKFCPVCGAPAANNAPTNTAAQSSDDLVAAMQAAAQASLQQEASSVQSDPAPMQQAAFPGVPMPSNSSGSGVAYSGYTGGSTAVDPTPFPANNTPSAAFSEMPAGAAAAAVTPIKKKNKAGIIIAACAGVVVVAAAVAFFAFRGPVMNLFMGNNGYAAMIEGGVVNGTVKALSDPSVSAGISSAVGAGMQNSDVIKSIGEAAAAEDFEDYFENNLGEEDLAPDLDSSAPGFSAANTISFIGDWLNAAYKSDGVTVNASADITLTDTAKALLTTDQDAIADIDEVISAVNDVEVIYSVDASDNAAAVTLALKDSALSIDMRGLMLSDGSCYVMFPFNGGKAIKYTIEQDGTVSEQAAAQLTLDEKELERLFGEITEIYLNYYKESEITVESGEITVYGLTANGKLITAELDSAAIKAMFTDILDKIADDEYLCGQIVSYASANGISFTAEDYKKAVTEMVDVSLFDDGDRAVIKTIVDNGNNVLAKSYTAIDGENSLYFAYVSGKEKSAFEAGRNERANVCADVTETSAGCGTVNISFSGDEYPFAFKIDYENVSTAKFCDRDTPVGKFTVTFTPPADFTEGTDGDFRKFIVAVGSSSLVIEGSVDGAAYTSDITYSIPQYGSVGFKTTITPSGADGALNVPSDVIDLTGLVNSTDPSDEDYAQVEELSGLFAGIRDKIAAAEGSPLSAPLSTAVGELVNMLDSASVPKADYYEVSDFIDGLYYSKTEVADLPDSYPKVKDSGLIGRAEALADEYDILYSKSLAIFEDSNWDMPLEDFNELRLEAQKLDKQKELLIEDFKAANESAAVEVDYSDLSFDELYDVIVDLEDRLIDIALYNYEVISEDEQLTALFNEASDAYDQVYEDYMALDESMADGSLPVQLMRNLRRSTEALAKAVDALEAAVPGTTA